MSSSTGPTPEESTRITQLFKRVRLQMKSNPILLASDDEASTEGSFASQTSPTASPTHYNGTNGTSGAPAIGPLPARVVAQLTRKRKSSEIDSLAEALNEKLSCASGE